MKDRDQDLKELESQAVPEAQQQEELKQMALQRNTPQQPLSVPLTPGIQLAQQVICGS